MLENKANLVLLTFALSISGALFFASIGMVDMFLKGYEKPLVEATENHQLMIQPSEGKLFFDLENLQTQTLEKVTPGTVIPAVYKEDIKIQINGRLEEDQIYGHLKGNQVIASKRVLELFDLKVGDDLILYLSGQEETFSIIASALNEGMFYKDGKDSFSLMASHDYLNEQLGLSSNQYNMVMAKVDGDVNEKIKTFNQENTEFKAEVLYDISGLEQVIDQQKSIFYMMLSIVVVMSGVIIYGTFKLIITKRLPVIGTFYSQGATKKQVRHMLLGESVLYGLTSGLIASALGIGILFALHRALSPLKDYGIFEPFSFELALIPLTLAFSIVLSLVSSLLPIVKSRKYQVKNLILNISESKVEHHIIKGSLGLILLVTVVGITLFKDNFSQQWSTLLLILSLIGLVISYPLVMDVVIQPIHKKLKKQFGKISLPLKHVSEPGPLKGNITILIIVMLSVVMIVSLGDGLTEIVFEAYDHLDFDLLVEGIPVVNQEMKQGMMDEINSNPFIDGDKTQEDYQSFGKIDGQPIRVSAVDPKLFYSFNTYIDFTDGSGHNLLDTLSNHEDQNVVIASKTAKRLDLKLGEQINFSLNGFERKYTITGIVDAKIYNNGDMIFINNEDFSHIYNSYDSSIYLMSKGSQEEAKAALEPIVKAYGGEIVTFNEMRKSNMDQNASMVKLLGIFSVIAAVIGAFGALNNMFISYIQRKKVLAILNTIGLSKNKIGIMLLKESVLSFLIASLIVLPYGYLMMALLTKITHQIGMPLDLTFKLSVVGPFFLISGLIYVLATLPLMMTNRKLSVINEIRS